MTHHNTLTHYHTTHLRCSYSATHTVYIVSRYSKGYMHLSHCYKHDELHFSCKCSSLFTFIVSNFSELIHCMCNASCLPKMKTISVVLINFITLQLIWNNLNQLFPLMQLVGYILHLFFTFLNQQTFVQNLKWKIVLP